MAISLNNYGSAGPGTTVSANFTVNSGDERALFVSTQGVATSAVTFNGVSLTQLSTANAINDTYWYGMLMPPVGTYTLSVTFAGDNSWSAVCLNNVDQTDLNLAPPSITVVDTQTSFNVSGWCGDMPTRNMYMLASSYANGTPGFTYDTAFDVDTDFDTRTAYATEFTTTQAATGSVVVGLAGYGVIPASGTWKLSTTHNWSGVPLGPQSYLFVNETLTPPFSVGTMMII